MNRRGLTLLETLFASALLVILFAVAYLTLRSTAKVWRKNSGKTDVAQKLQKLSLRLQREVLQVDTDQVGFARVPSSFSSGGADGDAFWYLSSRNPDTGESLAKADGTPFGRRNILYYQISPHGVEELAGGLVKSGKDEVGYEDRCPYKVVIRKVIDSGVETVDGTDSTAETLLEDVDAYLTRPQLFDVSGIQEAGVESVEIVAVDFLSFRVGPGASGNPQEVLFQLAAVNLEDYKSTLKTGEESMISSPLTEHHRLSVVTKN